jgi:hypothetical protein
MAGTPHRSSVNSRTPDNDKSNVSVSRNSVETTIAQRESRDRDQIDTPMQLA